MALRPRRASIVGMLLCMIPVNIDAKYLVNNPYFSKLQKLCTNPTCLLFFIIVRIEVVIARHAANYTYKTHICPPKFNNNGYKKNPNFPSRVI